MSQLPFMQRAVSTLSYQEARSMARLLKTRLTKMRGVHADRITWERAPNGDAVATWLTATSTPSGEAWVTFNVGEVVRKLKELEQKYPGVTASRDGHALPINLPTLKGV